MRILLCGLDTHGFLYPQLGIGLELQRRGHEVAVLTGRAIASEAAAVGLPVAGETDCFRLARWGHPYEIACQARAVERVAADWHPDLALTSALAFGPLIAAQRADVPVAVLGLACYVWSLPQDAGKTSGVAGARVVRHQEALRYLGDARALLRLGAERAGALDGDLLLLRSVPELMPDLSLPSSVSFVGPCLWEPNSPEPELEAWLASDDTSAVPVVYAQPGSAFGEPGFWDVLLELARRRPLRIVASVGRFAAYRDERPEGSWVRPHVPQARVLARASVVICSGNTTAVLGAWTSGVPLIVVPSGGEQYDLAERCLRMGAAVVTERLSVERLNEELDVALDDATRQRARAWAARLSGISGQGAAATAIERLPRSTGAVHG